MCFLFFSYFFMGSQNGIHAWISMLALLWTTQVIPKYAIHTVTRDDEHPPRPFHTKFPFSVIGDLRCGQNYTAVSKKVVGKSARDNPERYCGWFCLPCSPKNFKEWHESPRTYVRKGNRLSRPKVISPGTRVMLPEIHSHVARNGNQQK